MKFSWHVFGERLSVQPAKEMCAMVTKSLFGTEKRTHCEEKAWQDVMAPLEFASSVFQGNAGRHFIWEAAS